MLEKITETLLKRTGREKKQEKNGIREQERGGQRERFMRTSSGKWIKANILIHTGNRQFTDQSRKCDFSSDNACILQILNRQLYIYHNLSRSLLFLILSSISLSSYQKHCRISTHPTHEELLTDTSAIRDQNKGWSLYAKS